ncbi:hypothetical protein IDR50_000728 [Campylobacter lari]|nr:hypothetical protein [Campylobacter lari]EGG0462234.1 hypothetical protein [Campylobacter lari]EGK8008567.1 hypothetical protein [Campylobacter lari]EGK8084089.1 hypothetical protein [Campylobacter lari]EJV5919364.1 HipA domain-containing protein [Campylobacter lari]
MNNSYQILEFSSKHFIEPLGTKEKFWTQDKKYLFKIGRENTLENCSEKIACELAKLINLPCAEYELAIYKNGNTSHGVASKNFLNSTSNLVLGNELLSETLQEYDENVKYKSKTYTLDNVLSLNIFLENPSILENMIGCLVFDVFIGNQDRHHENWGIVFDEETKINALAPSFDHAAGVASKISEEAAKIKLQTRDKNQQVLAYCLKSTSAFSDNNGKRLKNLDVLRIILSKSSYNISIFAKDWIEKIKSIDQNTCENIINKIPNNFIGEFQKSFILEMLDINKKLICDLARKNT